MILPYLTLLRKRSKFWKNFLLVKVSEFATQLNLEQDLSIQSLVGEAAGSQTQMRVCKNSNLVLEISPFNSKTLAGYPLI